MRCLAVAGFAAMNIMLLSVSVWAGNATDITPETRDFFHWLSALIALPAAAFAGQPFFASAWRALRARRAQHGRADLARRDARARHVGGRDRDHAEHAYFDSRDHAAVLPAGRALARSRHAAQDARGRRQSRGVEGGDRAPLRCRRRARAACRRRRCSRATGCWCGRASACRPTASCIGGASEIDESLITGETARRDGRGRAPTIYAGSMNIRGALTLRVTRGRRRHADRRDRAAAGEGGEREVALPCGSPTAPRGFYAPVVHVTAALTAIGWLVAGAVAARRRRDGDRRADHHLPLRAGAGVPAVQVVASGALFRAGVILNAGDAIERLAEVDTVVFDKTGTLTLPRAARRQCRRRSIPICSKWRRGWRCRAGIRSPWRWRARRASAMPYRRRDRGARPGRARA